MHETYQKKYRILPIFLPGLSAKAYFEGKLDPTLLKTLETPWTRRTFTRSNKNLFEPAQTLTSHFDDWNCVCNLLAFSSCCQIYRTNGFNPSSFKSVNVYNEQISPDMAKLPITELAPFIPELTLFAHYDSLVQKLL